MTAPATSQVLRFCYFGNGRGSWADRAAMLSVWTLTLVILSFNACFRLLFPDGNLLIRGVATAILAAPLPWLFARGKRSLLGGRTA